MRPEHREPRQAKKPKVIPADFTAKVVQMHDGENLSFSEISRRLTICDRTVRKAYDLGRPDILAAAAATGEPPQRSKHSRLSQADHATVRSMIRGGSKSSDIIAQVGCCHATVIAKRQEYLRELIRTSPQLNVAKISCLGPAARKN